MNITTEKDKQTFLEDHQKSEFTKHLLGSISLYFIKNKGWPQLEAQVSRSENKHESKNKLWETRKVFFLVSLFHF